MQRLDKKILELFPDFSRSRIEGLVKSGHVTVNGATAEKAGMKVSDSDEIEVEIPPPVPAIPEPEDIPLDVVFEDDDMIVINKAPGMVVHPAPGHFSGTLVNALLHHCPALAGIGGVARPGIVHRLDQDTSGLIVVAKSQKAMEGLTKAFASHANIEKTYLAIVHGRPRLDAGRIENLIGRHPVDRKRMAIVEKNGKLAITNWQVTSSSGSKTANTSAVVCRIETGRTHQIRVHMASRRRSNLREIRSRQAPRTAAHEADAPRVETYAVAPDQGREAFLRGADPRRHEAISTLAPQGFMP